ncbi:MAG: ferredoxin [bacterium]
MKIKIVVDPDLCIGAASCVTCDPSHFEMNDENKAYVIDQASLGMPKSYERTVEATAEQYDTLLMAAQSCPTLAVLLYNEAGEQLFPEV